MTQADLGVRFEETQRFNLIALLGTFAVVCAVMAFFGSQFAITSALSYLVIAGGLYLLVGLTTSVDNEAVSIRFGPLPLAKRRVLLTEIEAVEPIVYRPIRDFGGWGVRWGMPFSAHAGARAYNTRGDRGVHVLLAGGESIVIGSQKADALYQAIEAARC